MEPRNQGGDKENTKKLEKEEKELIDGKRIKRESSGSDYCRDKFNRTCAQVVLLQCCNNICIT